MTRVFIYTVPAALVGFLVATLVPEVPARLRNAVGSASDAITKQAGANPERLTAEDALTLLSDEERQRLEAIQSETAQELAIDGLAGLLMVNGSLEEQLESAQASRDALLELVEHLIGYSMDRPLLYLQESDSAQPPTESVDEGA